MYLYLMRHAEALAAHEAPQRSLSERGKEQVAKIASFIQNNNLNFTHIYHSDKARSYESAQLIAEQGNFSDKLHYERVLNPDYGVGELTGFVESLTTDSLLVGHLPNLELLSTYLLTGIYEPPILSFNVAALVCFKKTSSRWTLEFFIEPYYL